MQDLNGNPLSYVSAPPMRCVASQRNTALTTTAADITLNAQTRMIYVRAAGANVFINLCAGAVDTVTSSSFDRVVYAGETRYIALPTGCTTINCITDTGTVAPLLIEEYSVF